MLKTFKFEGQAKVTFQPNHEGKLLTTELVDVFLNGGWVDIRDGDGKVITVPREEVFEIEWIEKEEKKENDDDV